MYSMNSSRRYPVPVKDTLGALSLFIGVPVAFLLAPAVGLVAQPILGAMALVQSGRYFHYWEQTKDENGVPISQDVNKNYMKKINMITKDDLPRLESELKRLEELEVIAATGKWAKGLGKCIIPVVGVIWSAYSEIGCSGCGEQHAPWSEKEAVSWHIQQQSQKGL